MKLSKFISVALVVLAALPASAHIRRSTLELSPGAHQLTASAAHPSGQFTTNVSVWFTNNAVNERVSDTFDAGGYLTQRVWKSPNGTTNRTQSLDWDSKGRLVQVYDLDGQTNGFLWWATYDGLGRRYNTTQRIFVGGEAAPDRVFTPRYDPLVEFLELGIYENRQTTWKVYGPDLNGRYGGLNGTGGLEAVVPTPFVFNPTLADARGNVLGTVSNSVVTWTAARPTGYGAVPGYRPLAYGYGGDMAQSAAWRGRSVDITGWVNLGARLYNPESGSFLNSDPLWNGRDPNYYSFAGGDPINGFDPDGRVGKAAGQLVGNTVGGLAQFASDAYFSVGYAAVYPFSPDTAESWYGQSARGLANTVAGTAQTTYDVAAWASYALMEPFAPDTAYNAYGGSMARVDQLVPSFYGGDDNSTAYKWTYGTLNAAAMLLPTRVGNVGRGGEVANATRMVAAESVATPYGAAVQATTAEARAGLAEVQSGATVYRQGWTGTQRTFDAQNWALQNPATTPNFAGQLGMPAAATQGEYFWMMGGRVTPGSPVITRPAPGIGGNIGGSMEGVVNPGGVGIDWFHMP